MINARLFLCGKWRISPEHRGLTFNLYRAAKVNVCLHFRLLSENKLKNTFPYLLYGFYAPFLGCQTSWIRIRRRVSRRLIRTQPVSIVKYSSSIDSNKSTVTSGRFLFVSFCNYVEKNKKHTSILILPLMSSHVCPSQTILGNKRYF